MRLLVVGQDPDISGGIPRYTVPVARELARRGLRVDYIASGGYMERFDWTFRPRWLTRDDAGGIRFHILTNPESVGDNPGHPKLDLDSRDRQIIGSRIRHLAPDIIHFHSFLGIPFEVIADAAAVAPTFVSVHDFGLVCQRRVLLQPSGKVCASYVDQSECPSCVSRFSPSRYRLRARLRATPVGIGIKAAHLAERATRTEVRVEDARPTSELDAAAPEAIMPYRRRLDRSVELVNDHVHRVLAVSHDVADVLVRAGIRDDRVTVMHIGSGSADAIRARSLPCARRGHVTFLYLGGYGQLKGADVLIDALERLEDPPRVIFAGHGDRTRHPLVRDVDSGARSTIEFRGPFGASGLDDMLADADVVIVPSLGPDTSPQTVLEAQAAGRPVIATTLGGARDFVIDDVNGRLVNPGDPAGLAAAITELSNPDRVLDLGRRVTRPVSVSEHVTQLIALYEDVR